MMNLLQFSATALGQATAGFPAGKASTAATAESSEVFPEGPSVNASGVLKHLNTTQLDFLLRQAVRTLVPKDLKPLSVEEIRTLNASFSPSPALLDTAGGEAGGGAGPAYEGWYCGASTRFDVAEFVGSALSVDWCYTLSCVDQFRVSSTCGPYFYTNGNGNCKCCDYDSKYYRSSADPPNNLYACR